VTGIQGMLLRQEGIGANLEPMLALVLTTFVGFSSLTNYFAGKRREDSRSAKLWLLAVLAPFLLLGAWQMHTRSGSQDKVRTGNSPAAIPI